MQGSFLAPGFPPALQAQLWQPNRLTSRKGTLESSGVAGDHHPRGFLAPSQKFIDLQVQMDHGGTLVQLHHLTDEETEALAHQASEALTMTLTKPALEKLGPR